MTPPRDLHERRGYSIAEAATLLGVSESTLRRRVRLGEFAAQTVVVGERTVFPRERFDAALRGEVAAPDASAAILANQERDRRARIAFIHGQIAALDAELAVLTGAVVEHGLAALPSLGRGDARRSESGGKRREIDGESASNHGAGRRGPGAEHGPAPLGRAANAGAPGPSAAARHRAGGGSRGAGLRAVVGRDQTGQEARP